MKNSAFYYKKNKIKKLISFKNIISFSILLTLFLFFLQFFQINFSTKEIITINQLKEKINNIKKENQNEELILFQKKYLNDVESRIKEMGFKRVEETKYIYLLGEAVITRR